MEEMNYQAFWRFIKLLNDNELLEHVVLIGSWCEYIYAQSGYLNGYSGGIRTLDIDFLVVNMRRPTPKVNLKAIAVENGYTIDQDVLTGATKIFTPDLMEIEFIIEQKGAGTKPVLETNIGVNAQALHHVSILKKYSMNITMFDMSITLPEPEAYVIHKIVINGQRGKKSEKDLLAIERLMPFLNRDRMLAITNELTNRDRRTVIAFIESLPPY